MRSVSFLSCAALLVLLPACAVAPEGLEDSSEDVSLSDVEAPNAGLSDEDGKADSLSSTATYYTARRDMRRCRFPFCGGWWISRLNFAQTKCADGTWADECYVSLLDWEASGLDGETINEAEGLLESGRTILRGTYGRGSAGEFDRYALLRVREAHRAIGEGEGAGTYYFVNDTGLRCITTPCFSTHEAKLNSTVARELSDIDVSSMRASEEDHALALELFANDRVIVQGENRRVPGAGPAGAGLVLDARQAFVRMTARPVDPMACTTNEDCGLTLFPTKVTSAEECYCPGCPMPISSAGAADNEASWRTYCLATHSDCPVVSCAAPPPVGCREEGYCGYFFIL